MYELPTIHPEMQVAIENAICDQYRVDRGAQGLGSIDHERPLRSMGAAGIQRQACAGADHGVEKDGTGDRQPEVSGCSAA